MPVGLLAAMLVVILAGVLVTGGVTASAKSLPGDLLYPIKTSSERVQLFIARDPMVRSGPRAGIRSAPPPRGAGCRRAGPACRQPVPGWHARSD